MEKSRAIEFPEKQKSNPKKVRLVSCLPKRGAAARAEGFKNADLGRFNVWRPMVVDRTELVTKTRTNEKVVRESSGEQLLKGYRGEIAQRLMNTASVVEQQVFRNRI